MAEIVNLRQARKQAARRKGEALADGNRVAFGLPKDLKQAAKREADRAATALDGHRLAGSAGTAKAGLDDGSA